MPKKPVGPTLKIVLAMLLWAACFPLITLGLDYSPHLTFAALRAALAGVTLVVLAILLGRPFPREPRIWMLLAIVGFGATSLGFLGMFHAAEFVTPGIATVIANSQPLMAAVLAAFWLGEKLSLQGKFGLVFGFLGVSFIALPQLSGDGNQAFAIGVAYILLAALGVTISNVVIKLIAEKVDAFVAMGLQLLIGSVPLTFAAFGLENPTAVSWTPSFVVSLFSLALLGSALVYWLWFSALEVVPLTKANAFSFLVPVFGLTIGFAFFGENLSATKYFGIAMILIGIFLVSRSRLGLDEKPDLHEPEPSEPNSMMR